jgi:hypothetical protein
MISMRMFIRLYGKKFEDFRIDYFRLHVVLIQEHLTESETNYPFPSRHVQHQ